MWFVVCGESWECKQIVGQNEQCKVDVLERVIMYQRLEICYRRIELCTKER